ncbi:MAG: hypothetical protein HY578_03065 [Nitrospinae bacterium]|nr:hypothetical protein [Nitrospinota bacterium]
MIPGVAIRYRLPQLAVSFIALLFGVLAGLARMDWQTMVLNPNLPSIHGPLMVAGFLGTLISLERAVAMDRLWAYSAPGLTALGIIFLLTGISYAGGSLLFIGGSLGLVLILGIFFYRQPAVYSATLVLGALSLFIGNFFFYYTYFIYTFVFWWIAFLIFTIAGERLELSRMVKISRIAHIAFIIALLIFIAGLFSTARLIGIAMVAISLWLLQYDVASRTLRHTGLPRFIAVCLVSGYVWLSIGGILIFLYGNAGAGPYYDASLHSILLGFVFAMIFGHAPIIFPAVIGIPVPFHRRFYIHLILLQLSLLLRLIGDFSGVVSAVQWGGLLNAITLLIFFGNTASAVISVKVKEIKRGP